MKTHLFDDMQWCKDKLSGRKKISCAEYSYFTCNGWIEEAFYRFCRLLGNSYKGPK